MGSFLWDGGSTTSPWSPDDAGDSECFCKQASEINGVTIVINDKAFGGIEMTISEYVL